MVSLNFNEDGIGHINVYSRGRTQVGKMLSNFTFSPFVLPDQGAFDSIEGYWYWLTRQNDLLRKVDGFEAKKLGRKLPVVKEYTNEEFVGAIKMALDAKLRTHREIRLALKASRHPLVHYYIEKGEGKPNIVIPQNSIWIMDHLALRRQQLNPSLVFERLNLEELEAIYSRVDSKKIPPIAPQLSLF